MLVPPLRVNQTVCFAALLVGWMVAAGHAAPGDKAPNPSPAALRLIGDEAVEFQSQSSPVVPVKLPRALGTADFALGASFKTDESETRDLGDLASLWNATTRHGFSLGVRNNTGCTSSQPNWRQLQFGVDAGTEPKWRDEGRPGDAILGFSLAVHDGQLYVGTCEPGAGQAGQVYRYAGPDRWEPLGRLDGANAVTALASFGGQLYAGAGKYRLAGSALTESENLARGGKVFRFVKPGEWELVGDLAPTDAIAAMTVYGGKLYASSLYKPAGFFRYEGGRQWTSLPTPGDQRVEALAVHDGAIYAGSYDRGSVLRYDGAAWQDLGLVAPNVDQTYSFALYQGALHVGAWPDGRVHRLTAGGAWSDAGRLGDELEVMAMLVHNGVFYAGSLPKAEVYRYEGDGAWKRLKQLDETPDVKYRRVWTMATYQGRLFATTLPSGKVWSMSAGNLVTDDRELGPGWHDVVAQRRAGVLRLFVDGRLAAQSDATTLNLETDGLELTVGNGPRGPFAGSLKNVWFDGPR